MTEVCIHEAAFLADHGETALAPEDGRAWRIEEIARHVAALQGVELTAALKARVMLKVSAVLAECRGSVGRPVPDDGPDEDEPEGR